MKMKKKTPAVENSTLADLDFTQDLKIDVDSLDVECLRQPVLYGRYGRLLADARRSLDRAKYDRDVTHAELSAKVRSDPEHYNLSARAGNEAVEAVILLMPECRKVDRRVITAQHAVEVLAAAVYAMGHRKEALENLVRLCLAEYFSGPISPHDPKALRKTYEDLETKSTLARDKMRAAMRNDNAV